MTVGGLPTTIATVGDMERILQYSTMVFDTSYFSKAEELTIRSEQIQNKILPHPLSAAASQTFFFNALALR